MDTIIDLTLLTANSVVTDGIEKLTTALASWVLHRHVLVCAESLPIVVGIVLMESMASRVSNVHL